MVFFPTTRTQIRDITGVVAGATALINCPKGPRYRKLILALQNSAAANGNAPAVSAIVNEIKVILGSKTVRQFTGTQLDYLNTLNGSQYASYGVNSATNGGGITYLPIFFEEPWRKRPDVGDGLAVQTGWLDTNGVFQVSVQLQAGITPVLGCIAVTDAYYSGKGANQIMKVYVKDSVTNSAELDLANIFQGAPSGDMVESLALFDTSDAKTVTKARLTFGGVTIIDDETYDQMTDDLKGYDMNPSAGAFNIVFDHDDQLQSLYPVKAIGSSQLTLTLSGASAGSLRMIQTRLGDPTV
jgi:hypothetical protein